MTQPLKTSGKGVSRILIVDDHPIVRDGIVAALSRHADLLVCGEAASVTEAMKAISRNPPDLAIIDLSLSDGSGLNLIKRITARNLPTRILVLTMSDESLFAGRALRAGASGFLNKQEARAKLIEAIRNVLAGHIYVSPAINERLLRQISAGSHPLQHSPVTSLSDRELEVFELIGTGLRTSEIAKRLHLGIKTIETHKQRIKDKLALKSGMELIRQATQWVLENR